MLTFDNLTPTPKTQKRLAGAKFGQDALEAGRRSQKTSRWLLVSLLGTGVLEYYR